MSRTIAVCLIVFSLCAAADACAKDSPIGRKVAEFTLKDYRGKAHSLGDFRDRKVLVLAFLGTECPLAKLYAPRLQKMAADYADRGVQFLGVNANVQDSITEIAAHARIHKISFPILKDLGNQVADQMGAVRTPEVFVLDEERVIRYWGRIDDQYGVGYIRDEPRRHDLKNAIDQLLAGKAVELATTESVGCHIGRVRKPKADSTVTYSNQISRILQKRCLECHRDGEIAPFALTDYDEVVGWAEMIEEVVRDRRMPPWHADPNHGKFLNDRHLTDKEKGLIYQWVADGAPEGDPSQLPKPRTFVDGWQLPQKPDVVIPITKTPYEVPAEGTVRYKYFFVDPGFKEDKWIKAAELQPGNHAVVHHILAFARAPGGRLSGGGARGYLVGYVPGLRARPFPDGMAKRIPAGSKLVFQMHYTPIGSVQLDQSKLGLVFADPDEVKYEVKTNSAVVKRSEFEIPPGNDNYRVDAVTNLSGGDALLLSMMPHMHLRGKSFLYEVQLPSGKAETLLNVPNYDFNWQTAYRFVEPKSLPRGTKIHCVAHYDNSEDNLNNPDPSKTVRWGDQTWDEMMIGYFDVAVPVDDATSGQTAARPRLLDLVGDAKTRASRWMKRLDRNRDNKISREEVSVRLIPVFDRIDKNNDDVIDMKELEAAFAKRRD